METSLVNKIWIFQSFRAAHLGLPFVTNELQKIAVWFRANKKAVNTSKTKFIVFRTHGKRINPEECVLYFNNNEPGQPVDPNLIYPIYRICNEGQEKCFKLLGVMFNEYLSFDAHISHICVKISKSLFCINRIKNFVNKNSLLKLYYAMVHSHLAYCINVYGYANSTNLQRSSNQTKRSSTHYKQCWKSRPHSALIQTKWYSATR